MIPSDLKTETRGFVRLVNFLDSEGNPFGNSTKFKSLDLAKRIRYFTCSSNIFTE